MSLLKELHLLHLLTTTQKKVISMFLNNAKTKDLSHLKDPATLEKAIKQIRAQDSEGILKGLNDEALKHLVKLHLEPTLEAEEAPETDEEDEPRLLVKAGDFKIMVFPNELVKIMDTADNVRLEMPLVIWKQLSRG